MNYMVFRTVTTMSLECSGRLCRQSWNLLLIQLGPTRHVVLPFDKGYDGCSLGLITVRGTVGRVADDTDFVCSDCCDGADKVAVSA